MRTNKKTALFIVVSGVIGITTMVVAVGTPMDEQKSSVSRDAVITGRVVDLQTYMTGKFQSSDKARCTRDCIEAGVPAALETKDGLIVIGHGDKSPRKELARWALQYIEIKGTLYERSGVRYMDLEKIKLAKASGESDDGTDEIELDNIRDDAEEPDLGDEGACCLPSGSCIMTYSGNCTDENGEFNSGYTCDDIRCDEK